MRTFEVIQWLIRYAWFIAVGLVAIQFGFRRMFPPRVVREAPEGVGKWRQSLGLYSLLQALVFGVCGIFQFAGGYEASYYVLVEEDHFNPFIFLPRLTIYGSLFYFLGWIWFGNGAEVMVKYRYSGVLRNMWVVRIYFLLSVIVLLSVLSLAMFTDTFRWGVR